jgi:phosphoglucosamine mutase
VSLRFGTDGVRGVANVDLTPEDVLHLGRCAGTLLAGQAASPENAAFVIGEDTRRSSPMLSAALAAGLASVGADVLDLGVVPTAAVAIVTRELGYTGGAVVSASHNPAADNGVKFFAAGGQKLDDAVQQEIEAALVARDFPVQRPSGVAVGRILHDSSMVSHYSDALLATVDTPLVGLRIVVDAANGAAYRLGPQILERAGAVVEVRHAAPDGSNINDGCGATAPDDLAGAVLEAGADMGVAFDGDADRLIAVDDKGDLVDGDAILVVCALDRLRRGRLRRSGVVTTVMSNQGLFVALRDNGVTVVEAAVGDRNVLVELERHGLDLGGEQSGHIVFRDLAPTGCGIITALQLAQIVVRERKPLSELVSAMHRYPQVLRNVPMPSRDAVDSAAELWAEVASVAGELGDTGRVVVRPSGTEPKLRIMVQAPTQALAEAAAERIAAAVPAP